MQVKHKTEPLTEVNIPLCGCDFGLKDFWMPATGRGDGEEPASHQKIDLCAAGTYPMGCPNFLLQYIHTEGVIH
jgi:hypothetical protein